MKNLNLKQFYLFSGPLIIKLKLGDQFLVIHNYYLKIYFESYSIKFIGGDPSAGSPTDTL